MIFVTVGTTPFDPLIKEIDTIAKSVNRKFLCQIASGKYAPKNCQYFRFKPSLIDDYLKSKIVVTHGGAGTIFELLKLQKKIIAVPNLDRTDSHQTDLISALASRNCIMACYNMTGLKKSIETIEDLEFTKYKSPECNIAEEIIKYIGSCSEK